MGKAHDKGQGINLCQRTANKIITQQPSRWQREQAFAPTGMGDCLRPRRVLTLILVNKDKINGVAGEGFTAVTVLHVAFFVIEEFKYLLSRGKVHNRLVLEILWVGENQG